MSYSIKISGLDKLKEVLGKDRFLELVNTAIKKGMIVLQGEAIKNTPTGVRGILKNSYKTVFTPLKGELYNTQKYGLYVHEGTKPHWVGINRIKDWANAKGINPYILQRSIARKGTKPNKFMDKTYFDNKDRVSNIIESNLINNI